MPAGDLRDLVKRKRAAAGLNATAIAKKLKSSDSTTELAWRAPSSGQISKHSLVFAVKKHDVRMETKNLGMKMHTELQCRAKGCNKGPVFEMVGRNQMKRNHMRQVHGITNKTFDDMTPDQVQRSSSFEINRGGS